MNTFALTNAQHAELHELLERLGPERVWKLKGSDACGRVVRAHVSRCRQCSTSQDDLLEAKLAQLPPAKRERIEELGRCLARQFINRASSDEDLRL